MDVIVNEAFASLLPIAMVGSNFVVDSIFVRFMDVNKITKT